jgi:hypothetical protein
MVCPNLTDQRSRKRGLEYDALGSLAPTLSRLATANETTSGPMFLDLSTGDLHHSKKMVSISYRAAEQSTPTNGGPQSTDPWLENQKGEEETFFESS